MIQNVKVGNSIAKVNTIPICSRIAKRLANIAVNHLQIATTRKVIQNVKLGNSIAMVHTNPTCPRIAKRHANFAEYWIGCRLQIIFVYN